VPKLDLVLLVENRDAVDLSELWLEILRSGGFITGLAICLRIEFPCSPVV